MRRLIGCILCFVILLLPSASQADIIFFSGFETGDFSEWDQSTCPLKNFVEESAAYTGNYGMRIGYSNTGSGSVDCGVDLLGLSTHALSHFWITFRLKLDASIDAGVSDNRKIVYMWGQSSWDLAIKADGTSYPVNLSVQSNDYADAYFAAAKPAQNIYGNTWYYIEMEVDLGTSGVANDDTVRMYVDGSLAAEWVNVNVNNTTNYLDEIRFGAQQEGAYPTPSWTEDRWFDDISISTTRLSATPTPTPTPTPTTHRLRAKPLLP